MSDRPTLLLEHHLKELRLPTFLREYGKMASECAERGWDIPDYLLRLAELELIDRHHRAVERRIKAARFPAPQWSVIRPPLTAPTSMRRNVLRAMSIPSRSLSSSLR